MAAIVAGLRRWIEAIHQMNNFAFDGGDVGKNTHELAAGKVTNFATPQRLHPLHAQVFKEQIVKLIGQEVRDFEEPITAFIHHPLIDAGYNLSGFLPSTRKLNFACQVLLSKFQFDHRFTIVQRAFNRLSIGCGEECLQTKVEPCAVTCHGLIVLVDWFINNKVHKEIAERITFNCDRLDAIWNITRLGELINIALNTNSVFVEQLPPCLLEGERTISLHLLEAGRAGSNFTLEVAKEQLIALVDALDNILNRLRTDKVPVAMLRQLLKLGDVLHQRVRIQAPTRQLVVSAMQRYAVVVDRARNVDLLMQMFILFLTVQFEFVRFHALTFLTLVWQVGQQWRSYLHLVRHEFAAKFLELFAISAAGYKYRYSCLYCISI